MRGTIETDAPSITRSSYYLVAFLQFYLRLILFSISFLDEIRQSSIRLLSSQQVSLLSTPSVPVMDESPAKMYALATVLTILAIVAVMLRLYARRIKKLRPSWDDYLVILALVTVILTICVVGLTDMFIQKIPIIGTGVCMFVGNFLQRGRYHKVVDFKMCRRGYRKPW